MSDRIFGLRTSNFGQHLLYRMRQGVSDIVWPSSVVDTFKNPIVTTENIASVNRLQQWLDNEIFPGQVENAHFMVWMRNAALPSFR